MKEIDSWLQWFVKSLVIYPLHNWPPTSDVLGNKSLVSKILFRFQLKKWRKDKCIRQMFPVFCYYMQRNPAKNFDCNIF